MKYHIFTNDVGSKRDGYSRFMIIEAKDHQAALLLGMREAARFAPVKVLAVPENENVFRKDSKTSPGGLKPLVGMFEKYGVSLV